MNIIPAPRPPGSYAPRLCKLRFGLFMVCILWVLGLAPSPAWAAEPPSGMFELYAQNRDQGTANYITGDFLLLSYSLIRRRAIAATEQGVIMPKFRRLVDGLGEALTTAEESPVTRANRGFIAILGALLDGTTPAGIGPEALRELALVRSAAPPVRSPLWGMPMDYTQFQPRGRYQAEGLQGWFRALRYAGTVLFAVTPSQATGVSPQGARRMTAQALQLARLIAARPELQRAMAELDATLGWQFGPAAELGNADLLAVAEGATADTLPSRLLAHARGHGLQPRVIGGVVEAARLEPGLSAADAITGWRLLPPREGVDAVALQALVYDRTGGFRPEQDLPHPPFGLSLIDGRAVKGWASGKEIMAALGSSAARQWIETNGEDRFESYPQAMERVRAAIAAASGLAALQRDLIVAGLGVGPAVDSAPPSDPRRRLESMLGFWTWQRYLDLLYAKQSYTLSGKALTLSRQRPGAIIEPVTALYKSLARVVDGHRRHTPAPYWEKFDALLRRVVELSDKAAHGEHPNVDEEAFLNGLDLELLRLTGATDGPIVVDVQSNPAEGKVLQEGIGYPRSVAPTARSRGARFAHYEFKQPMSRRLTDGAWRDMLATGTVPGFTVETAEAGP